MNKVDKKAERNYRRHVRIWKFLYTTCHGIFSSIFGYSFKKAPKSLKAPYLVVSNHNADLDPVFVGFSFPQQMYIVASEHLYRLGFVSKLLKWAFEPIAKIKGSSDTLTVMKMIRYLRSGKNVLVFPEGNRSFNGVTCQINDAIGKLVKTSGATLVTYKLTGAYLTTPRWGYGTRKGYMHGEIVQIYEPEKLKEMTPVQIAQIIRNDLQEDAFATQDKLQITYKGKNRAVGFESAYCVCPDCKQIGTIATSGNEVYCTKCGKRTEFTEKGYFANGFNFRTTYEWDVFQEDFYKNFVNTQQGLFFSDSNIIMRTITADHEDVVLGVGTLEMYKEKLVLKYGSDQKEILITNIPDMSIYGKCGLMFTDAEGVHYELLPATKGELYNARKYLSCWNIIRNLGGE